MRKIIGFTLLFVWLGFLWGLYFVLPASASAFCEVLPTRDGFVALRKEPRASARLIGRVKAGDEVMIGQGESGRWIEVTWYRGQDRLEKGFEASSGTGWVNKRLISGECG